MKTGAKGSTAEAGASGDGRDTVKEESSTELTWEGGATADVSGPGRDTLASATGGGAAAEVAGGLPPIVMTSTSPALTSPRLLVNTTGSGAATGTGAGGAT